MSTQLAKVDELPLIAEQVHDQFAQAKNASVSMLGPLLEVGRLLSRARALFASDPEFGKWFAAQHFPFNQKFARTIREIARREEPAVAELERQVSRTGQFSLGGALKHAMRGDPQVQTLPLAEPHYARMGGRDDTALRADYARPESVEAMLEWFQDLHIRLKAQERLAGEQSEYAGGFTAGQLAVTELAIGFLTYLVGAA